MGDDTRRSAPKPHAFLAILRRLAALGAIRFSYHAEAERMEERDFDTDDVIEALSHGELKGPITAGKFAGEWKGKLVCQPFGTRRWMGVVTVVVREKYLRVLTAEWEDWR
jgi:Domain of unknown function (DUF4258)